MPHDEDHAVTDQLPGGGDRLLGIAEIVRRDQLHLLAEDAASGVEVGYGQRRASLHLIAEPAILASIKAPKTRAGVRKVSLPAAAIQALQDHRRHTLETRMALGMGKMPDDALVFPDPLTGDPQSPRAFTKRWSRLSTRIASGVRWHSLRHLHASLLVHHGVDLATVATRLGHAQIDTTLRTYTHQVTPDDRHAADALDRALGRAR